MLWKWTLRTVRECVYIEQTRRIDGVHDPCVEDKNEYISPPINHILHRAMPFTHDEKQWRFIMLKHALTYHAILTKVADIHQANSRNKRVLKDLRNIGVSSRQLVSRDWYQMLVGQVCQILIAKSMHRLAVRWHITRPFDQRQFSFGSSWH